MKYGKEFSVVIEVEGKWVDIPLRWPGMEAFRYPDGDQGWWLTRDFSMRIGKRVLTVLEGFDFDAASIPRIVWSAVGHPLMLDRLIAALYHDMMYCTHDDDRALADTNLAEIMQACGASWAARNSFYSAVRTCGWRPWPKTEAEILKYKQLSRWSDV